MAIARALLESLMIAAPRCDRADAWKILKTLFETSAARFDLREAFAVDARRFDSLTFEAAGVFADLSKNLIDQRVMAALADLARECRIEQRRDAMLAGAAINATENRAVLHVALRAPRESALHDEEVHEVLERMLAFAERVRDTRASGIRHIVNIGIGGSDLGPQMVVPALDAYCQRDLALHFVSNVDGHDIDSALRGLKPVETLFVIASKTFTTQETMSNARIARDWFVANGGTDTRRHFVAATTNIKAAAEFGIDTTFGFWDWVGGRYSLWSAIGLPIALAVGAQNFRELLGGAQAMDRHFRESPIERNLPIQLGLLDVWYRNFHGFTSRSIAPYHQGLRRLPAYLQQLEMESNGKRVDIDGQLLPFATSPVIWGEAGTNGQHAYFQMLHQGSDVIPVEFILERDPAHVHADAHRKLLANGLAQAQALMLGRSAAEAIGDKLPTASPLMDPEVLARHRTFPGNRPSSTFLIDRLAPAALGALIAMYEHRVFVSGALWNINSFDQWGVELGKMLCNDLLPRFDSGDTAGLDGSTAGLLQRLRH
ncbi:MAG: glucose-6-phosphate isomerase [Dokdonella sp.]|uniref:glucose-6-phosphate isomerase n=1 Tax=Dokdonella sp. TaxID=2291710 RepID=UPI003BB21AE4